MPACRRFNEALYKGGIKLLKTMMQRIGMRKAFPYGLPVVVTLCSLVEFGSVGSEPPLKANETNAPVKMILLLYNVADVSGDQIFLSCSPLSAEKFE